MLVIMFQVLFIISGTVSAHNASYGYSKWYIQDKYLDWTMVIDDKSIMELGAIDANNDSKLSEEEVNNAYPALIKPYLDKKLIVKVDDAPQDYKLVSLSIINSNEVQMKFHLESRWAIEKVGIDYRLFYELSNNQHKNISLIYLPKAQGNPVEHIFQNASPSWEMKVSDRQSVWVSIMQFIRLGIEHILTGYDHILFLITLVVIGLSFKNTIKIITAFTVAHSITLILAATGAVHLDSRLIEIAIALTICYVAIENIFRQKVTNRWVLSFLFGLIHGFGFANVLQEIGIPRSNWIPSLISFNVGVEIGQLMLFAVLFPLLVLLQKRTNFRITMVSISAVTFIFGFLWFIERVFNLRLLGF
jgi:hydrogenase/urease accessory protein HupE